MGLNNEFSFHENVKHSAAVLVLCAITSKVVILNDLQNFVFHGLWSELSSGNAFQTQMSVKCRPDGAIWSENTSNGRFHCVDTVSDGLPSFAWLQRFFAVRLPFSASCELKESWDSRFIQPHTHTQRMLIV